MTAPSDRVAVTGVGMVSALGFGAELTFAEVLAGRHGIRPVTLFDTRDQRCSIAGEVRDLDVAAIAPRGERERFSRTDAMALVAAREAVASAGVSTAGRRLGIAVGGTTGGMFEAERELFRPPRAELAPARVERLLSFPLSTTSEHLAAVFGAAKTSTVCSACSSGAIALGEALSWLRSGEVDVALAGGADGLCQLTFAGFNALGATAKDPCRPFDRDRSGLSLGEGAAFLLLERESDAVARGARVLAWLTGAAVLAEAHHITHPEPTGTRAARLMRRALENAGLGASAVGYVNAHGTGTRPNDAMEAVALHLVFGERAPSVLLSSSKSQLGHTLGAAGALEAALTVLSVAEQVAPPTTGLSAPEDPSLGHVIGEARPAELRAALSSSYGFGGMGAVLVFERADAEPRVAARVARAIVVSGWGEAVTGAPGELDPERSRRFDESAASAVVAAEQALTQARLSARGVGLVLGSAYGNVQRSIAFLQRLDQRGPKFVNPAEFPHLVASAAAGNVSVYAGFDGPVLTASERERSAESALSRALALLALGTSEAIVAGAVSMPDPLVDALLGPRGQAPRSAGAAFLALEDESACRARGGAARARLVRHVEVRSDPAAALASEAPPGARSALVLGLTGAPFLAALEASPWASVPRREVIARTGLHEAVGAFALLSAVRWLEAGEVSDVLVLSGLGEIGYLTRLAAPQESGA